MSGIRGAALLLVGAAALWGCGSELEESDEASAVETPSRPELAGEPAASPSSAPGPVPPDLPLYPGSEASRRVEVWLVISTPDSPKKVFSFYSAALPEQGWTLTDERRAGADQFLKAEKDDRALTVTISGDIGRTEVYLVEAPAD